MFASFSYQMSPVALVVGLLAAIVVLFVWGLSGRPLFSAALTGISWGVITFIVLLFGEGGFLVITYVLLGVPGATVLGAASGFILARLMSRCSSTQEEQSQNSRESAGPSEAPGDAVGLRRDENKTTPS